jgi:hypothetical protein
MLQKALNDNRLCSFVIVTHAGDAAPAHGAGIRISPRFQRACAMLCIKRAMMRKCGCLPRVYQGSLLFVMS